MLEILGIILLCNVNRANAIKRGRAPGAFIGLTIGLWLGLEMVGAFIGALAGMEEGAYLLALLFAICGAVASYFITKNCAPGTYVDPRQAALAAAQAQAAPGAPGTPGAPGVAPAAPGAVPGTAPAAVPGAVPAASAVPAQAPESTCAACGAPLEEGHAFCGKCGTPRASSAAPQAAAAAPAPTATAPAPDAIPVAQAVPAAAPAPAATAAVPTPAAPAAPAAAPIPAATPARALPADLMPAVWAGVILSAGWIVLFVVQAIFRGGLEYNSYAGYLIAAAVLGVAVFLFSRQNRNAQVAGAIFGAVFALLYACSSSVLYVQLFLPDYISLSPVPLPVDVAIRFLVMLLGAAAALGAVVLVRRTLGAQASPQRDLLAVAGCAAAALFVFACIHVLVRWGMSSAAGIGFSFGSVTGLLFLMEAAVAFLSVFMLDKLCPLEMPRLRLRGLGLAWACIAVFGSGFSLVSILVYALAEGSGLNYASSLLLAGFALAGYIMLLYGRRMGLYLVTGAAALMLGSQFLSAFGQVVASGGSPEYLAAVISSIIGALNPVFAWLSVRFSSDPVAVGAPGSPAVPRKASAFDKFMAIFNIVMAAILLLTAIVAATAGSGSRALQPIVILLLAGGGILACGICALVMQRPRPDGYPTGMWVANIVAFCISALIVATMIVGLVMEAL